MNSFAGKLNMFMANPFGYSHLSRRLQAAKDISETLLGVDNLLSNDFLDSCSYAPKYQSFFVDESVGKVYILASGSEWTTHKCRC